MPDLCVEYHWICAAQVEGGAKVKGSKGNTYDVQWGRGYEHCTCKGFKFRGTCKHVSAARDKCCKWNAFFHDGEPLEVAADDDHPNGKACPECGGEVTSMGWGV